jgi:hypothetical protein
MAPSTPPPPASALLAAFTMASAAKRVMSPWTMVSRRPSMASSGAPPALDVGSLT